MKKLLYTFLVISSSAFAQEKTAPASPQTTGTESVSATAPEITFTETSHDFGMIKKSSPVVYKFQYKNTGKEPLVVKECRVRCACLKTFYSKEPLKPGKTSFIEVHYDSSIVGNFGKEVIVISNAKNAYVNLIIKGTIQGEAEGTDAPMKNEEKMKSNENK